MPKKLTSQSVTTKLSKIGLVLVRRYQGSRKPITIRCKRGHLTKGYLQVITQSGQCRVCAKHERIARYFDRIRKKGFLIHDAYKGVDEKYDFSCRSGHRFTQSLYNLYSRLRCPKCGDEALANKFKKMAESKGYKLTKLSKNHVTLTCKNKHTSRLARTRLSKVGRCQKCHKIQWASGNLSKLGKFIDKKGGKLLTTTYDGRFRKIRIQCANDHVFYTTPDNLLNGRRWCPTCVRLSLGEEICRKFFELAFGVDVPKARPKWLQTKHGERLELDGYSESAGIAFEHHGRHHYEKVHFTSSTQQWNKRRRLDSEKRKICKRLGIILIEISQIHSIVEIRNAAKQIHSALSKANIQPPNLKKALAFNYEEIIYTPQLLSEAQQTALRTGQTLVSTAVAHRNAPLSWRCPQGHEYRQPLGRKRYQSPGCPKCYDENRSGEDAPRALLTQNQAEEIRRLKPEFTARELSKLFQVSISIIKNILSGKTYKNKKH